MRDEIKKSYIIFPDNVRDFIVNKFCNVDRNFNLKNGSHNKRFDGAIHINNVKINFDVPYNLTTYTHTGEETIAHLKDFTFRFHFSNEYEILESVLKFLTLIGEDETFYILSCMVNHLHKKNEKLNYLSFDFNHKGELNQVKSAKPFILIPSKRCSFLNKDDFLDMIIAEHINSFDNIVSSVVGSELPILNKNNYDEIINFLISYRSNKENILLTFDMNDF
jgi:hypothetical protein